jgi:sugar lactone lactonase YvrE
MPDTLHVLSDAVSDLGEGPAWAAEENALYWIDLTERIVWRHDTVRNETRAFKVTGIPTAIVLRQRGGLLVTFRNGLAFLDTQTGAETRLETTIDFSRERFNDGKCDRRGRLFVGSLDKSLQEPLGGLWRLDPDLNIHRVDDDIFFGNGMAFSPDDRTMYFCDSRIRYVYAYDYDIEAGTVANRRVHLDFRDKGFHPDGCTVDSEGCLWLAEMGAGRIGRYAPDGSQLSLIEMPVTRVTSVAFGGPDLKTLYITSMRNTLDDTQLAAQPDAGRTFFTRPGATGLPEPKFAG